jgi:hypothetical protein
MIRWFALRAKPNCEARLCRRINAMPAVYEGEPRPAEAIAPMERVEWRLRNKPMIRPVPIIRGYVFVGMLRPVFAACRAFPEAGQWMGIDGVPRELPYRSIQRIREIEAEMSEASKTRTNRHLFGKGQQVRRKVGNVIVPATVVAQLDDDVRILVSMLGKMHEVRVRAKELEAA